MSMILGILALRDANLQRLLDNPPLVWQAIAPGQSRDLRRGARRAVERRAADEASGTCDASQAGAGSGFGAEEGLTTDLDKAWHGIHYLLTRTAWEGQPAGNFLVTGGREVGDLDVGYGPARVLTYPQKREQRRDWLNNIEEDELRSRFNPEDMLAKEIYPDIWARDPEEDDTLGYLWSARTLRGFLNQAVDEGLGILVYLT